MSNFARRQSYQFAIGNKKITTNSYLKLCLLLVLIPVVKRVKKNSVELPSDPEVTRDFFLPVDRLEVLRELFLPVLL